MASAQLNLQAVEFAHPGMTAPLFTDLTVQFPSGWTGIVGPNGAGKTTLLKVAMGELTPQGGTVQRQGLALYVAQRTDEPPEFFEDFIWAPDAGLLKARLRVGDDWPERWATLSHGERKRAQIAVALWREPAVLALDEPSNHIDAEACRLLREALQDFGGIGLR
jgi:ATPase subunit of ABC transporter with duplicated ATPase domains